MRSLTSILIFSLITILLFYAGLNVGVFEITFQDLIEVMTSFESSNPKHITIVQLRLPRIILAFLVGGALSLSGYIMQAMINNPLADPYILGTASGASLGANLVYSGMIPVTLVGFAAAPAFAFAGSLGVTLLAVYISYERGHIAPGKLLLVGVALSSFMVSLVSLIIFFADTESKLRSVVFWSLGSFERASWDFIPLLGFALSASVVLLLLLQRHIVLLMLGENNAYNLGLNVVRFRWMILIISSLLTGIAVSTSGPVGFVGLFIPHIIRAFYGVTGRLNVLLTAWLGALAMLGCDLFSRFIYPPAGIPVGVITAFVGIPFFVYLLWKRNYNFQ